MEVKSSIVPDTEWSQVIETLATSEQVDASTLTGLVRMAYKISGDLSEDAREAVSLIVLESLFPQGDEAVVDADAGQNGKITFDLSESCENVLEQIISETPKHLARLEKEKWDVRPFLTHKRLSLRKCVLEKLKDGILESSHPFLTSLKERSNLLSENVRSMNDGKYDDIMENIEVINLSEDSVRSNASDDETLNKEINSMEHDDGGGTEFLINVCVKCDSSGDQLLVCSTDACPIRVHERCLGFSVKLDENGNFFCPHCTYSRIMSKYKEAERKASKARNDLQPFNRCSSHKKKAQW